MWTRRRQLWVFAAATLCAAFIVALIRLSEEPSEPYQVASADEPFIPSKYDEHLLVLDREAVNNGYRDQIEHLIAIWFKDDAGQPTRAMNGASIARKRYIDMMTAIEKREADLSKLRGLQEK